MITIVLGSPRFWSCALKQSSEKQWKPVQLNYTSVQAPVPNCFIPNPSEEYIVNFIAWYTHVLVLGKAKIKCSSIHYPVCSL